MLTGQEFTGEKPGNGTSTQQEPGAVSVVSPEIMENWVFEPLPTRHGSSAQLLPLKGKLPFLGGKRLGFEDDPLLVPSECTYYWKGHGLRVVNYYF